MWDCLICGCKAIAASLLACPMCKKGREDVPKITAGGGPSNADAAPGEPGYHGEDEAAEVAAPAAEPEPERHLPQDPAAAQAKPASPAKAAAGPQDVTGEGGIKLPALGAKNG